MADAVENSTENAAGNPPAERVADDDGNERRCSDIARDFIRETERDSVRNMNYKAPPREFFTIELKSFEIVRESNEITITERRKGNPRTARFPKQMAVWIAQKIFSADLQNTASPFWGSYEMNGLYVSMLVKQNSLGTYLSLRFLSSKARRRATFICIPKVDSNACGWELFGHHLLGTRPSDADEYHRPEIVPKATQITNTICIHSGFEEKMGEMERRGVTVAVDSAYFTPEILLTRLDEIFKLSAVPKAVQTGPKAFIVAVENPQDVTTLLRVPKMIMPEGKIWLKKWSPKSQTLAESWLRKGDRWIELEGIPLHLREVSFLAKYCRGFGSLVELTQSNGSSKGLSVVKGLIRNCDLSVMPHVLVLKDKKNLFPVRIVLSDDRRSVETLRDDRWTPLGGAPQKKVADRTHPNARYSAGKSNVSLSKKGKAPLQLVQPINDAPTTRPRLLSIVVANPRAGPSNPNQSVSNPVPTHTSCSIPQNDLEGNVKEARVITNGPPEATNSAAPPNPNFFVLPDLNLMVPSSTASSSSHSPSNQETHKSLEAGNVEGDGRFDWDDDLASNNSSEEDNACSEDLEGSEDDEISGGQTGGQGVQSTLSNKAFVLPDLNQMAVMSASCSSTDKASRNSVNMESHRSLEVVDGGGEGEVDGRFDWAEELESSKSFDDENEEPEDASDCEEEELLCPETQDSIEDTVALATKLGVFGKNSGKSEEHFRRMWQKRQLLAKKGKGLVKVN